MQKQECDLWIWKWTQASDIPVNLFEVILGRSVTRQLAHLRATVQEAEPNRKIKLYSNAATNRWTSATIKKLYFLSVLVQDTFFIILLDAFESCLP